MHTKKAGEFSCVCFKIAMWKTGFMMGKIRNRENQNRQIHLHLAAAIPQLLRE